MISCLTTRCAKRGEKRKKWDKNKGLSIRHAQQLTVIGTTLPVYQEVPKKTRGNMT